MAETTSGATSGRTRDDIRITFLIGCAYFFTIGAFHVTSAVTKTLVIEHFGATGIPKINTAKALLALATSAMVVFHRKFALKVSTGLGALLILCAVYIGTFPLLYNHLETIRRPAVVALSLAGSVLINTSVYGIWMLFTTTVAKADGLLMGFFGALPQVAMILATSSLGDYLEKSEPIGALHFSATASLIAVLIILLLMRRLQCAGGKVELIAEISPSAKGFDFSGFLRFSYTYLLAVVIIANFAFGALLNFRVYDAAENQGTQVETARFLAAFFENVGWFCLFAQLLIVPLAFKLLTPRHGLIILPIVGLGALGTVVAGGDAMSLLIPIATYISLDYTVNNCMRESLYIPLPLKLKVHYKSLLALVVPKIGTLFGALLILADTTSDGWPYMMLAVAVVWGVFALRAQRAYTLYDRQFQRSKDVAITVDAIDGP